MDVNGTYRTLFDDANWEYTGLDLEPGPGVDRVLRSPYSWSGIRSRSFDVVVTGQAFEHIEFPWITMLQITRVLVEDGLLCMIVPSGGHEHRFPVDCWRYYPDGVRALARWADLKPLSAITSWQPQREYPDDSAEWADTVLIARRPIQSPPRRWFGEAKRSALRHVLMAQGTRRHSLARVHVGKGSSSSVPDDRPT
jgi:SAM-dependent methyltransferase